MSDEKLKDQQILLKDFGFVFEYMDSSEVFNKNYLPLLIIRNSIQSLSIQKIRLLTAK